MVGEIFVESNQNVVSKEVPCFGWDSAGEEVFSKPREEEGALKRGVGREGVFCQVQEKVGRVTEEAWGFTTSSLT